jgi:hypothetical protein
MPMAYMLAKGPIMSLLETMANGRTTAELQQIQNVLDGLRDGTRLTQLPLFDSANQPGGSDLIDRLENYWFGRAQQADQTWVDQPAFDPQNPKPTGYWRGYHGDVESVLRQTMVRAVEVALGIDGGQGVSDRTRHWPVEVFWACPHPWVEGWVTWRSDPDDPAVGQVTVVFATPGDTVNQIAADPTDPPEPPSPVPLADLPAVSSHGMWLVSESKHAAHTVYKMVQLHEDSAVDMILDLVAIMVGSDRDTWFVPSPTTLHQGFGDIVTVDIPAAHGGPVPEGVPYVP